MKGWRAGLERASDWAQKYGWSIPVFAVGILFGLSVTVSLSIGSQWFETITALGTMAAAFAAFWSVYFSRRIQQRRDDLEDKVRKPYFQSLTSKFFWKTPNCLKHQHSSPHINFILPT